MRTYRTIMITSIFCIMLSACGISVLVIHQYVQSFNQRTVNSDFSPTWREITPGKTTKQDVINLLGKPSRIVICSEIKLRELISDMVSCLRKREIYEYEEESREKIFVTHKVFFNSDIVSLVIEDITVSNASDQISVYSFVEQYDTPEYVTWSTVSPYLNAVLFCEYGVIVHANLNRVEKVYYFEPLTLAQCLQVFDSEVAVQNPNEGSDIIKAKDPWGFNTSPLHQNN